MFLALTANKTFWNNEDCDVLLGKWCVLSDDNTGYDEKKRTIIPYVFDDRSKLHESYLYADKVYNRMMPRLTAQLNTVHQVEHSQRYWEITVGYWLREYIEILLERYECIRVALKNFKDAETKLIHPDDYFTPDDGLDFEQHSIKDIYNQQLYGQIIEHLGGFKVTYVPVGPDAWQLPCGGWRSRLNLRLKNLIKWISLLGSRWNRIYICSMYFPVFHLLKIACRLKIFPTIDTPRFKLNSPIIRNMKMREVFTAPVDSDEFESILWDTLKYNMPRTYIENLTSLKRLVQKHYPKHAKIILTANAFAVNEGFKLWTAEQTELNNMPYVIHQHGGNYGSALWNSTEDYETRISDYYLTYGWEDSGQNSVVPFYASRILGSGNDSVCGNPKGDILWVLASLPRYAYTMYALPVGPQFNDYLNDQIQFLRSLGQESRSLITCRQFYIDYGWSDMDRIKKEAGNFNIDYSKKSLRKRLLSARLCVCTYNGTTYFEPFAANIPTILFWPRKHWEIRPTARKAFDILHEVGILHHSPEKAAQKIDSILDNTFEWWQQPDIQQARKDFCQQFVRVTGSPDKTWAEWLLEHAKS